MKCINFHYDLFLGKILQIENQLVVTYTVILQSKDITGPAGIITGHQSGALGWPDNANVGPQSQSQPMCAGTQIQIMQMHTMLGQKYNKLKTFAIALV